MIYHYSNRPCRGGKMIIIIIHRSPRRWRTVANSWHIFVSKRFRIDPEIFCNIDSFFNGSQGRTSLSGNQAMAGALFRKYDFCTILTDSSLEMFWTLAGKRSVSLRKFWFSTRSFFLLLLLETRKTSVHLQLSGSLARKSAFHLDYVFHRYHSLTLIFLIFTEILRTRKTETYAEI